MAFTIFKDFLLFLALKMKIVSAVCKQQMFEKKKKQKIFDEIHEVKEMFLRILIKKTKYAQRIPSKILTFKK